MRETPQAAAAYASYAAMGPERSLVKLAEELGQRRSKPIPLSTLKLWSSEHQWQARVIAYDAERIEERRRKRDADIEKMNERHALLGTSQQAQAITQLARLAHMGKLGGQASVMLLKLAIDVERTARGEPTVVERHEQTGADGGAIQHEHTLTDDPEAAGLARALIQRITHSSMADASGSRASGE